MRDERGNTHLAGGKYPSMSEADLIASPSVRAAVEAARETEARFGRIEASIQTIAINMKNGQDTHKALIEQVLEQTKKTNGTVVDLVAYRAEHKVLHSFERDFRNELDPRLQEIEGNIEVLNTERHDSHIVGAAKAGMWRSQYTWLTGGIALGGSVVGLLGGLEKLGVF